ncbi:AbrB/MazE/SpoVT family DNA-binding domain-containing protein [Burkholderia vietnamiensis]|uniref:AbrB/MazE/SpoVT family DNA-binding domain-containing protein n=1 Tax=Burkholderia vietnamiensis TaxID=60552 RepID=UPI00380A8A41
MVKGYGERRTLPFVDVGDGSGDKLLPLPAELLKALGWAVGDELKLTLQENGKLRLRRAKPARSRNTR